MKCNKKDFDVNCLNSDAKCFKDDVFDSKVLVNKDGSICDNCVYNLKHEITENIKSAIQDSMNYINIDESEIDEFLIKIKKKDCETMSVIDPLLNIGENIIDLRKIESVGKIGGDSSALRYSVFFTSGKEIEIFETRRYAGGMSLPQMKRSDFVAGWRAFTANEQTASQHRLLVELLKEADRKGEIVCNIQEEYIVADYLDDLHQKTK